MTSRYGAKLSFQYVNPSFVFECNFLSMRVLYWTIYRKFWENVDIRLKDVIDDILCPKEKNPTYNKMIIMFSML